jgi:nitrogen fixation protein FixH
MCQKFNYNDKFWLELEEHGSQDLACGKVTIAIPRPMKQIGDVSLSLTHRH